MSSPYSLEHLAEIRNGARRMVERTRAHEGDLNNLVDMAEEAARQATALSVALTRRDTNADGVGRLCSDQARLSVEHGPDVIVMDLTMPVLNGLEATRLIKATQATRESRVIAYTGNGSIPPPLERWFVAVVSKPSPPDIVLAAVQNAVGL